MGDTGRATVQSQLERLRAELAERRAAVPAHTVRVHQIARIEELEDRIAELERQLAAEGGAG